MVTFYDTDLAFVHDSAFTADARAIAPELVRLFAARGLAAGRVLELGCGSGVTAEYPVARGYEVHGIDLSAAMVRLARARVPAATFRRGDIATARLPKADAAIAIGEVVTYATGRDHGIVRLGTMMKRVRAALPADGLFVFGFIESARGRTYPRKVIMGDGWSLAVSARTDSSGRWLTRSIEIVRERGRHFHISREHHRVRLFTRDEIRRTLESVGYCVPFRRRLGSFRAMRGDVIAIAASLGSDPARSPEALTDGESLARPGV